MRTIIGAQGEITIIKIDELPNSAEMKPAEKCQMGSIISHSENGNHHVLTGGDVMERTSNLPSGMRILYGILDEPASLEQDAATPHGKYDLDAGIYEFRISREYDPFLDQARQVAD